MFCGQKLILSYHRKRWHDVHADGMHYVYFAHLFAKYIPKKVTSNEVTFFGIRQLHTLPGRVHPSTICVKGLNDCVRYGNRWITLAIAAEIG